MKTNKKFYIAIATATIMTTMIGSVSAMQGQGNGQGRGNSMKSVHTPSDTIKNIALSDLSDQEKQDLSYGYSEEMVARDAYTYFYTLYGVETFNKIAQSEQEHMDAVKTLLDRYSLPVPANYGELQDTFNSLKAEGEKGLKEALEVGMKIEILDIKDITDAIKSTDNDDIKMVFTNIGGASYNHMRGFIKALESNGFTTTIDYSPYLTPTDLSTKGNLKTKLSDALVSEGVALPVQTSDSIKQANSGKKYKNTEARGKYKDALGKKYGDTVKKMDAKRLQTLDTKIDQAIAKTENSTNLSETTKEKYLNIYYALKEYLTELVK